MLDLALCAFVAPLVVSGFALPGSCALLKTGLALCAHQKLVFVYLLTPKPVFLGAFRDVDAAAYYNGTLILHPKDKALLIVGNATLPLPGKNLCYLAAKGGNLLAVGKGWAALYNLRDLALVWTVGRVSCPADLSPKGDLVALSDQNLKSIIFVNVTEGRVIKIFKGSFKDVSLTRYGYLLTSCRYSIFNGERLRFGGCKGVAWKVPLLLSCNCKGALTIYKGMDYCYDLGFRPSGLALVGNYLVVGSGGAFVVLKPYLPNK